MPKTSFLLLGSTLIAFTICNQQIAKSALVYPFTPAPDEFTEYLNSGRVTWEKSKNLRFFNPRNCDKSSEPGGRSAGSGSLYAAVIRYECLFDLVEVSSLGERTCIERTVTFSKQGPIEAYTDNAGYKYDYKPEGDDEFSYYPDIDSNLAGCGQWESPKKIALDANNESKTKKQNLGYEHSKGYDQIFIGIAGFAIGSILTGIGATIFGRRSKS